MLTPPRKRLIDALRGGKALITDEYNRIKLDDQVVERRLVHALVELGYLAEVDGAPGVFQLTQAGRDKVAVGASRRNVPRPTPISIYLGREDHDRRLARIDEETAPYGGRSKAMQALGDGLLHLVPHDDWQAFETWRRKMHK